MGCNCQKNKTSTNQNLQQRLGSLTSTMLDSVISNNPDDRQKVYSEIDSIVAEIPNKDPNDVHKVYSVVNAMMDTVKAATGTKKDVFASPGLTLARIQICEACDKRFLRNCKECGCIIDTKVKYTESKCPLNKW